MPTIAYFRVMSVRSMGNLDKATIPVANTGIPVGLAGMFSSV